MSNEKLRELCIKNHWFECGTNSQYEKLFEMNESGEYSIRDIALIIWLCSDNTDTTDIEMTLEQAGM